MKNLLINQLEITEEQKAEVHLTGKKRHFEGEISLAALNIIDENKLDFYIPPFFHYKIPSYIYNNKNSLIPYHENPIPCYVYLAITELYERLGVLKSELLRTRNKKWNYVLSKMIDNQ